MWAMCINCKGSIENKSDPCLMWMRGAAEEDVKLMNGCPCHVHGENNGSFKKACWKPISVLEANNILFETRE